MKTHKMILLMVAVPILLAACANVPTEQLIREAHACEANHIDERGIIGKPNAEAKTACWLPVNERLRVIERREQRDKEKGCCMRHGRRIMLCECISPEAAFGWP